ncbi:unnamed protein product [Didymodactylos carnosus]|uniref:Cytochrome P450 n=1 Tax=Didymodactylos carnosus TaxID=1234261 RepID=A0A815GR09_9BILA|nr:unnamed protein product [Didymodactylos carnosus]CAF1341432.1 unnamed protein product [Didymodactylos carnosus]CAF4021915.1 unnamed protein product [Didymodactylos carnosus]CAF4202797.1 unnamed protein product [Didymodactylos carnosus]
MFSKTMTFVTDSHYWNQIHRNPSFMLPTEEMAKAFDANSLTLGLFETNDLAHGYVRYLQGKELKQLTAKLAQHIRQTLISKRLEHTHSNWIECGLFKFSHMLIFESVIKTLYGDIDPLSFEREYRMFDSNIHLFLYPYPAFIFKQFYSWLIKAKNFLIEQLYQRQHQDQDRLNETRSLFVKMINDLMCEYPEQAITTKDIGSFNLALLWAAIGNTTPAVYWTLFYLLNESTETMDLIKQEINQYLSPLTGYDDIEEDDKDHRSDQLDKCIYLDSAINETLRLVATAMIIRRCSSDTKIILSNTKTLEIPKNETVVLFPCASHYDPHIFKDPFVYKYDRFLPTNLDVKQKRSFLPFGGGRFVCPGRYMAKNTIKLSIAFILQHLEIEFLDNRHQASETRKIPDFQISRIGYGIAPPREEHKIRYRFR